jgi:hypothetical protein
MTNVRGRIVHTFFKSPLFATSRAHVHPRWLFPFPHFVRFRAQSENSFCIKPVMFQSFQTLILQISQKDEWANTTGWVTTLAAPPRPSFSTSMNTLAKRIFTLIRKQLVKGSLLISYQSAMHALSHCPWCWPMLSLVWRLLFIFKGLRISDRLGKIDTCRPFVEQQIAHVECIEGLV